MLRSPVQRAGTRGQRTVDVGRLCGLPRFEGKVRTLTSPDLTSCARCLRIGLHCEPALPSQRGKELGRLSKQNKRRLDESRRPWSRRTRISTLSQGFNQRIVADIPCADSQRFLMFWNQYMYGRNVATNSKYVAIQRQRGRESTTGPIS